MKDIERLGDLLLLSATSLFLLGNDNTLWLVLEGHLDVFAATRLANEELGAQHHFIRIETGQIICGLDTNNQKLALIGKASQGTKVLCLSFDSIRGMFASSDYRMWEPIEKWILAVGSRLSGNNYPSIYLDLATNTMSLRIEDEPKAIISTGGLVWIKQLAGSSNPFGQKKIIAIDSESYFPVCQSIWISVNPQSEIAYFSVESLLKTGDIWRGIRTFQEFTLAFLLAEKKQLLETEKKQIKQKYAWDEKLTSRALTNLSTPFESHSGEAKREDYCSEPLYTAMKMVAMASDIELVPPQKMLWNEPIADPIAAIAKASGIRIRKITLKEDWWNKNTPPILCFTKDEQHPVAILRYSKYKASPAMYIGTSEKPVAVNANTVQGLGSNAYILYRPFPRRPISLVELMKFGLLGCKPELALIALSGVAAGALAIVNPYATEVIFDVLIPGADYPQLVQMAMLLVFVACAGALFMFARGLAALRLEGRMDTALQAAVWDRLLSLPVSFFRKFSSGDLAQRSLGISQIRDVMTDAVLNALLSTIFSLFSFALLFYYSLNLAFIVVVLIGAACLIYLVTGIVLVKHGRQTMHISGRLSSRLLQFMSGIAKFKVSGTEGRAFAAWAVEFSEQKRSSMIARKISNGLSVFDSVFPVISLITIFYANAYLSTNSQSGQLSTGKFLAFIAAYTQFLSSALTLSKTIVNVISVIPTYERAKPILLSVPEVTETKVDPGLITGEIELSHVSFAYTQDEPPVLHDLTLKIEAGQAVAFVGPSGCGKSTLLRLLLAFEQPESGSIYYDGQDLAGLDVEILRQQIGVVLQTSRPMSGSIFESVAGSAPHTVEEVWEACRMAGIEEDIKRMPMGLHTHISNGGGGISGGQKQRLMIARAIVKRPKLFLFDEATSALDNHAQATVIRSLAGLRATRIVIAHRLSTVIDADKIFVFDKGRIVEDGTYKELLDRGGAFYELAKRQLT